MRGEGASEGVAVEEEWRAALSLGSRPWRGVAWGAVSEGPEARCGRGRLRRCGEQISSPGAPLSALPKCKSIIVLPSPDFPI